MPGAGGSVDGRVLRGVRNREAVVEAFLSLIEEGDLRPTARAIAARAHVSLRSVFQHFDDLEQIYEVAGRRVYKRLRHLLEPVPATVPVDERIDELVYRRAALLDGLDSVERAARLREPFSEQLRANRQALVRYRREQTETTLAPELARLPAPERDQVLTAIETATSWEAWYHLRTDQGLDPAGAAAVMRALVGGSLVPLSPERC